jgi:magnesium transporter
MTASGFYHFSESGLFYRVDTLDDILKAKSEGGFIWLDFYNPSKEDLTSLIKPLGIHPLSIEDSLDTSQLPKIEHFPDSTFIIFNSYIYQQGELLIDEVDIFIGRDFLITVSGVNSDGRRPLMDIPKIVGIEPKMHAEGPSFLLHIVLDYLVDEKYKAFEALEDELDEAEVKVLESINTFSAMELMKLRKSLVVMRKSLYHEREILVKISRRDCPFVSEASIYHFRDIYDHLSKFFELS